MYSTASSIHRGIRVSGSEVPFGGGTYQPSKRTAESVEVPTKILEHVSSVCTRDSLKTFIAAHPAHNPEVLLLECGAVGAREGVNAIQLHATIQQMAGMKSQTLKHLVQVEAYSNQRAPQMTNQIQLVLPLLQQNCSLHANHQAPQRQRSPANPPRPLVCMSGRACVHFLPSLPLRACVSVHLSPPTPHERSPRDAREIIQAIHFGL